MRKLLLLLLFLVLAISLPAQSPHGVDFKINCATCHSSARWEIAADTLLFDHDATKFSLTGQHTLVNCKSCHETLVFQEASNQCISCHTDIHRQTVGSDCARCHTVENWLVDNITELHLENGFPLLGIHATVSCNDCHLSESELQFNRIGNNCLNCHLDDFQATTNPNHLDAGFSTDCILCHDVNAVDWSSENIIHDFFPLTKGHEISDCAKCHTGGDFANTSTDCFACHQTDYANAQNPNHQILNITTNCVDCHTTDILWMPAEFTEHDIDFFPIYSGSHNGEWSQCIDCHNNPSSFAEFTCTNCHTNPETDEEHQGIGGYVHESTACLACHPNGNKGDNFDHNLTNFPLTGVHTELDCNSCHANGFQGTPTSCNACHLTDFEQTTNPEHNTLGISTDCVSCHTTEADWMPAIFPIHNNYYVLNGAHAAIANDCATCHNGDYNNTPNTCYGCHANDYNQTTNPNHSSEGFPTTCESCHIETAWTPASINHDEFFVLDGAHAAIANECALCHTGDFSNAPNTCAGCHTEDYNQTVNPSHLSLGLSINCENCHTTQPGWMPASFDIHNNFYTLNGAHAAIANDCATCHNGDYNNTPNTCYGCHADDYNQANDPVHSSAGFPTSCESCHSETEWEPANFDHDGMYFPIYSGKHKNEWDDCVECHTIPGNFLVFSCIDCHEHNDPNDLAGEHDEVSGYSYSSPACYSCHPTGED